jgi:glutaminyl-tRNA synthetase
MDSENQRPQDFIRQIITQDLESGKNDGRLVTRFPPEPNGCLHIGHAKSICLNFGAALENAGGYCNLRFDDTNPCKEESEYVRTIQEDVRWLGFDWGSECYYTSNYFERLYEMATELITSGKAYVCDLSGDEIREYRGTLKKPGRESPFRSRSIEENLDLFEAMKAGKFDEGQCVLRAKIDMSSPNISLRDPAIYRVRKEKHHRTGDHWCVYPMYDFAHCLSDSIEGITHSLCSLEFENNRPLYNWFIEQLRPENPPVQIEFARLNLTHTLMSKRQLLKLVQKALVDGWDDPRMPTLSGMRRRGYSPEAIREFCDRVGIAKSNSTVDFALLEYCVREELNRIAPRMMAVLKPLKVVIQNYPEGQTEELEALNHPGDPSMGTRPLPFSKTLYIERSDFMEDPPKKYFRLAPGREVRLRYAYFIRCEEVIYDDAGEITELRCSYDPESRGGKSPDGRKVKGTIHWVSKDHAKTAEVRLYNHLFEVENMDEVAKSDDLESFINPDSLEILKDCKLEAGLSNLGLKERVQFERLGYFCLDSKDSKVDQPVFNRIVSLKDGWAKIVKKG